MIEYRILLIFDYWLSSMAKSKYNKILLTLCAVSVLIFAVVSNVYAASAPLANKKHSIKLDIIPLYSVLFDVRKQLRLGLEYERRNDKRYFMSLHLDAGLYDDYSYYKYYDFFNDASGFHYNRQDVKTYGFHLLPAWHYKLRKDAEKKVQFFTGFTADFNVFQKKIKAFNSQSLEKSENNFSQVRLGLGVNLGAWYKLTERFRVEVKTTFITNMLKWQSSKAMKDIKPFKSVWFDDKQRFWFIPQLNICYDF